MNIKYLIPYVILLVLGTGCSKEDPDNRINYEVILENHLSYENEEIIPEQYLIFKNESDWNNFIPVVKQVNPSRADYLTSLNFNFNENNLILIIGTYYDYCCSKININGVYKENGDIVVNYTESGPGDATAISQAYTLLKISKDDAE